VLSAQLHGEYITERLRNAVMRRLIHLPASWYDQQPNINGLEYCQTLFSFTRCRACAERSLWRLP
jgi:hypothetical protein